MHLFPNEPLRMERALLLHQAVLISVGEDDLPALGVDHDLVVRIQVVLIIDGYLRLELLTVVNLVIELSKLQVLKQVKGADLLDALPLAGDEALEVLVTGGLKVDTANLDELPGADSMYLSLLSYQI